MLLMRGQIDYKVDGREGLLTHNDIGQNCPSALRPLEFYTSNVLCKIKHYIKDLLASACDYSQINLLSRKIFLLPFFF